MGLLEKLEELRRLKVAAPVAKETLKGVTGKPKKGTLRSVMDYLDLPGNIVQNLILNGNVEGAGRNLIDLITKTGTLGFAGTDLSRPEDRPDIGLIGEIALDPMTYLSFGTGAALKQIPTLTGKAALKATSKALTRQGLKAVRKHGAKMFGKKAIKKAVSKRAKRLIAKGTAEKAAYKIAKRDVGKLTERLAKREVTRGIKSGKLPTFLEGLSRPLDKGGIVAGLPFTSGKTVALEGVDVLKEGAKYTVPGLAARAFAKVAPKQAKRVVDIGKAAVRAINPLAFVGEGGTQIAKRGRNLEGYMKAGWQKLGLDALGDIPVELRKKMFRAVADDDAPAAIGKMLSEIPDVDTQARVMKGLEDYKEITSKMADELGAEGFVNRAALPEWYAPQQLIDEKSSDAMLQLLTPEVARKGGRKVTKPTAHALELKRLNLEELEKLGDVETDLLVALQRRASAQANLISTSKQIRQANAMLGVPSHFKESVRRGLRKGLRKPAEMFADIEGSITEGQRFRAGVKTGERALPTTVVGSAKQAVPIPQLADEAADATNVLRSAPPAVTDPIRPDVIPKFGTRLNQVQAEQAARKAATVAHEAATVPAGIAQQNVFKATEEFMSKKMRNAKMHFVSEPTKNQFRFGFTDDAGEVIEATLKRSDDGVYELADLPRLDPREATKATPKLKSQWNDLVAGAYRVSAEKGIPVRVNSNAFQRFKPKLNKLIDKEMELYLGYNLSRVKPNKFIDLIEKNRFMRIFKSSATVGIGPFINPAFAARNIFTATGFQALTDPQMGLAGFKHMRPLVEGTVDKIARKFGVNIEGGKVFKMLAQDSLEQGKNIGRTVSGIDGVRHGKYTGKEILKLAQENAVIRQSYSGIEQIAEAAAKTKTIMPQWANEAGEFTENAFRLSAYTDLLGKGVDPEMAARQVSDMFVDYRYQSNADRVMRAVFPFSRFTMAQTPVTLEAIGRNPRLTQPLRALMAMSSGEHQPGFLTDSPNIPLGKTEEGRDKILGRIGHPLEDLSTLGTGEGVARTLEQGVAARLNPLLRVPVELMLQRSFYKGQELGKNVRAPAAMPDILAQAFGGKVLPKDKGGTRIPWELDMTIRNLPVSRQINEIGKLMDERKTVWGKSIDFISGAKVYEIDQDIELKRRVRDYLVDKVNRGEIGKVDRFFKFGDTDEELTAIIKAYYKIGKGSGKRGTPPPSEGKSGTNAGLK